MAHRLKGGLRKYLSVTAIVISRGTSDTGWGDRAGGDHVDPVLGHRRTQADPLLTASPMPWSHLGWFRAARKMQRTSGASSVMVLVSESCPLTLSWDTTLYRSSPTPQAGRASFAGCSQDAPRFRTLWGCFWSYSPDWEFVGHTEPCSLYFVAGSERWPRTQWPFVSKHQNSLGCFFDWEYCIKRHQGHCWTLASLQM